MKILHWGHSLFNDNGGLEEFVASLSRGLADHGHQIALVAEADITSSSHYLDKYCQGIRLYDLNLRSLASENGSEALAQIRRNLEHMVLDFQPDVIHLHSVGRGDIALLASVATRLRIPLVYTAHAPMDSPGHQSHLAPVENLVSVVICPSSFMWEMVGIYVPGWKEKRITVLNGVEPLANLDEERSEDQIFASGRHVSDKGFATLIGALPIVRLRQPRVRLVLAGAGPETAVLKNLARVYGVDDSIEWAGWVSRAQAREMVTKSAVACVPSIWNEPFGLVAAEASMAATPVVASNVGGLPEIVVHKETGLLCPPGDTASIGIALATILRDKSTQRTMGHNAHLRALNLFDMKRNVASHVEIYQSVASSQLSEPRH
jgi:glycosyltransferase involved in cell wall biosynthesis